MRRTILAGAIAVCGLIALAQTPAPPAPSAEAQAGGRLHGVVKCGAIPLPGVTITAQNTLTGKRYSTTTEISGAWSLAIPQNGRYVLRTQFAGFAPGAQEALLNATSRDQTINFDLMLASRAAALQQTESTSQQSSATAIRQLMATGAQNLSLTSTLSSETENQAGPSSAAGAALPSIAGNSDFSSDSVAISGQSGAVSPLAGLDMDRVRDAIETARAQGMIPDGVLNGGNFGGMGGGFGGGGFEGPGGFGGGRGNFRGFNPGQPHGAIFWIGSNSALNAEPFNLRGQAQQQPASGTNRFGITFMSAPYLPGVTKPSGKDTIFLTLSGTRSSTPLNEYATVPTEAEREGILPGLAAITPVKQANALLCPKTDPVPCTPYFPYPNVTGASADNDYNYQRLATQQSNSTQAGVRYMRSLGANATQPGGSRGGFGSGRRTQNQGLRQSINVNYNWSGSAADNVNIFPQLGGKNASNANSLQAGYTVGYHKMTSIFNANWNRSTSQAVNYFTNKIDIANGIDGIGIAGTDGSSLNYGLPNIVLSNIQGLSEQQPKFSLTQTIALSETLSWIHLKHNLRFGGDFRRVHRDFLGGSNATGTFTFTGVFSGSSLADFLLGLPQETTIDATAGKSYLRENVWDAYASDDWRASNKLTLTYGLRYEYFAPYTEKYNRLGMVDTDPFAAFDLNPPVEVAPGGSYSGGRLPDSLVDRFRTALAPRMGVAWRLPRQIVLRAGYGVNYTVGQYATFASTMARQPIAVQPSFVNEQTNEATVAGELTLADGFRPANANIVPGNYELDAHYHLPYVQAWNLDVQKTLPWSVVLNVGYNGSRGNHLDVTSAPRATPSSLNTDPTNLIFNYEQSAAFSKFNAGTLRVNKRLSNGISFGANYQYSHSIDNAGSVGGTSTVVAQDWQHLNHEEGNSSFDVRHKVTGNYLYELPFGKDKFWFSSGVGAHILEGFSVSGSFTFATGMPLTPSYQAASADVARGTAGTLRPDRLPGSSLTLGGGSLKQWFNTAAFAAPAGSYGTASRNSIPGPGTIQNNMSLSKTMQLGGTRSMELRATANNIFNTVQYSGVDTNFASPTFGQVTSAGAMRSFQFTGRFRF
jgi:hypothetical protein